MNMKKLEYLSCEDLKALATLLLEKGKLDIKTEYTDYELTFGKDFRLIGKARYREEYGEENSLLRIKPSGTPEVSFKLSEFIRQVERQHGEIAGELCIEDRRYAFASVEELILILRTLDEIRKKVKECQSFTILDGFENFLMSLVSPFTTADNSEVQVEDDVSLIRAVRRKERERAEIEEQKTLAEMVKELDRKVQERATPIRLIFFSLLSFFVGVILAATYIEYRIKKEESKVVLEIKPQPLQKGKITNAHGSAQKPLESSETKSGTPKLP